MDVESVRRNDPRTNRCGAAPGVTRVSAQCHGDGSGHVCGENSGGASYPYDCYLHNPATSSTAIRDYGAEQTKQLAAGTYRLDIRIRAGVSNFDKTFKPMLRPAVLTDTEYVPYAPTNRALYEMILAMQNRS